MVPVLLLGTGRPRSSAVKSAAVADFLDPAESGATDTMLLKRDGCSLFCLVSDKAVLKLRVATRLAMMEDRGQEVKLATGASSSFET